MYNQKVLFKACHILFGNELEPSPGFLAYLREEGITSAFRKRAMEIHPDKAALSGLSRQEAQKRFIALQEACRILRQHILSRRVATGRGCSPEPGSFTQATTNTLPDKPLLFGRFLYHVGIIEFQQIIQAVSWQKSGRDKIGELAIKQGYLDRYSVGVILKNSSRESKFGRTAWKLGLLRKDEIRYLLLKQRHLQKKIGQFFIEQGILNTLELSALLTQWKQHNRQVQSIAQR